MMASKLSLDVKRQPLDSDTRTLDNPTITGYTTAYTSTENIMRTFQVPVWFNVQAETQDEAWGEVMRLMTHEVPMPIDWSYVVEEPVDVTSEED